jgi:hypothetical protein
MILKFYDNSSFIFLSNIREGSKHFISVMMETSEMMRKTDIKGNEDALIPKWIGNCFITQNRSLKLD